MNREGTMKLVITFDEKKLISLVNSLDRDQAQMMLYSIYESDDAMTIVPLLEEIINANFVSTPIREHQIIG
jgi:hypothetical protein